MAAPAAATAAKIAARVAQQQQQKKNGGDDGGGGGGGWILAAAAALLLFLLILILPVASLVTFGGATENCGAQSDGGVAVQPESPPPGISKQQQAQFSKPLDMQPDKWYPVGATWYYPRDSTGSGTHGSSGADLTVHPDTFAELSVLTSNPANYRNYEFADANALGTLPYMTGLRVAYGRRSVVVYKRDIGYGQGAHSIDGQRYRIDLWDQSARKLYAPQQPASHLVNIELTPRTGAGNTLGDTPAPDDTATDASQCAGTLGGIGDTLRRVTGEKSTIEPNGLATIPDGAPAAVQKAIAAGNYLVGKPYRLGGGHGPPLTELEPTYDCSSAVSYILYHAGLFDSKQAWVSGEFASSYGQPGYGRWISVAATDGHVYMYVGNLRFDTHRWGSSDTGVSGIGWHTVQRPDRADGFVIRHPEGL